MEGVRDAIASSRDFRSCASFDPWQSVSCGDRSSFVQQYSSAFDTYLSHKKSEAAKQLHCANLQPRCVRFPESGGSGGSSVCSSPRSAVLPSSSFAVASPGSGSDSGTSRQRTYTAESSLAAILGQKKELKPVDKEPVTKKGSSKKNSGKESVKDQVKDGQKSPAPTRKRPGANSKNE